MLIFLNYIIIFIYFIKCKLEINFLEKYRMELSFNPYKPDLLAFLNKEICFYKLQKNEYKKTVKEYNEDLGKVSPFQSINFGVATKVN